MTKHWARFARQLGCAKIISITLRAHVIRFQSPVTLKSMIEAAPENFSGKKQEKEEYLGGHLAVSSLLLELS